MKNLLMACVLITLAFATAAAQQAANQFEIIPIRNNVYMLAGDGGNIALSVGPDGVLVVDTGTPANSDRLVAAGNDPSAQCFVSRSTIHASPATVNRRIAERRRTASMVTAVTAPSRPRCTCPRREAP